MKYHDIIAHRVQIISTPRTASSTLFPAVVYTPHSIAGVLEHAARSIYGVRDPHGTSEKKAQNETGW